MERYDLVERAYHELVQEGKIFPTTDYERHKAILTRRAAYYLNQANPNLGLLSKTSGNNIDGLSVDYIVNRLTGESWDIGTDVDAGGGARLAQPIDGTVKIDTSLIPRWVQPTYELAMFGIADTDAPHTDAPHQDAPPDTSNDQDVVIGLLVEAMRKMVQEELAKVKFPTYEGTIRLGSFLGTARIELKPKE